MPIPKGARYEGSRVRLSDGSLVSERQARNAGARAMGYANENDRAKHGKGDDKFFNAWVKTEQGKHALMVAKNRAQAEGTRFKKGDVKMDLIAARNARPNDTRGGRSAWVDFFENYDMDEIDYVDY
jgi:hypothetical protein